MRRDLWWRISILVNKLHVLESKPVPIDLPDMQIFTGNILVTILYEGNAKIQRPQYRLNYERHLLEIRR